MASDFKEKFNSFLSKRNGPDDMSRDLLIAAVVCLVGGALVDGALSTLGTVLGATAAGFSYWRVFSTKVADRRRENDAYRAKRKQLLGKVTTPFAGLVKKGQKAAEQAKDKEHAYFDCPQCHQSVRVPKGAGKIRVTCPKCGHKFERTS